METWQKILYAGVFLLMLFFIAPGIKGMIERGKQAEEKHWGSFLLIVVVLVAFIMLLISSLQ